MSESSQSTSIINRIIRFSLEQKLVLFIGLLLVMGWGIAVAPFDWDIDWMPRNPVAVDAIPNLGENQQIVYTEWRGRSPQDVEDQVTYPLTVSLMGVPGVQDVRSLSMFGNSFIFIIFGEETEFYWSRSRILERLNSLPAGLLPEGVQPALGPDATGLGQIFWYTLEGRDPDGNPVGGWDLHELRSIQDWYVRYGLLSSEGISEVASIGGYVQEYQVDVNPDAMRANNVTIEQVFRAIQRSNLDVGARTTEINRVEYIIRGLGFITELEDIEEAVIRVSDGDVPVRIQDVGVVTLGPAERRGVLDKGGAEAVGGVVVVREGFNPLRAITNVKLMMEEISGGLPVRPVVDWSRTSRVLVENFAEERGFDGFASASLNEDEWMQWLRSTPRDDWPEWINTSQVTIEPFYDRTGLIHETLGTLNDALVQQILVTVVVIILLLMHLRTSLIISAMLPLAVLMSFIAMKVVGVDANLVSLAGIAIAIGTIVDMGVIVSENVVRHLDEADPAESRLEVVYRGATEVGSAVLTAISTTVISFLPVFTMTGSEGKMFIPLAYTKTFVLIAAIMIALTLVPAVTHLLVARKFSWDSFKRNNLVGLALAGGALAILGIVQGWTVIIVAGLLLAAVAGFRLSGLQVPGWLSGRSVYIVNGLAAFVVALVLAGVWEPLGPETGSIRNMVFVVLLIGGTIGLFWIFGRFYERILRWSLVHKGKFVSIPIVIVLLGGMVWLGFDRVFGFIPATAERIGIGEERIRTTGLWSWGTHEFPGLGREFMPPLDEGSFLWMPTTMPHASLGEALEVMQYQNLAFESIPEVESAVGKIGRAESALDPAPVSMVETIINYVPEYVQDEAGRRINFRYDRSSRDFVRDEQGNLIEDRRGRPYRQWREHIRSPDDIWDEIVRAGQMPGTTSAPRLQPIETRLVMLQTGMRAPMGIKVRGPNLQTIEQVAIDIERLLREVPAISAPTVNADRVVGKPYLEIEIDRSAIARYGLNIADVQDVIMTGIGGMTATTTVEGRERYGVRVRYQRELRNEIEELERILVATPTGTQIPLAEVSQVNYVRGPQMIRSEDTFPVAYVTFGGQRGLAEVEVVEQAQDYLREMINRGELVLPAGVSYAFAGNYEHQVRAARTLSIVLPVALLIIFLILFFQFRSVTTTLNVFTGIIIAWAGGFVMIWLYGQGWFGNFELFEVNMRELFQFHPINLSVAVWVGFLALFGIAVDNGVVVATYLDQSFARRSTETIQEIREATVEAGLRRLRPLLMTTCTTILALLPILTSTGRGSDIMIPMAIPSVGGMAFVVLALILVPVLYCWVEETKWRRRNQM